MMAKLKKGLKSTHISTHCTIPSMQELGSHQSILPSEETSQKHQTVADWSLLYSLKQGNPPTTEYIAIPQRYILDKISLSYLPIYFLFQVCLKSNDSKAIMSFKDIYTLVYLTTTAK